MHCARTKHPGEESPHPGCTTWLRPSVACEYFRLVLDGIVRLRRRLQLRLTQQDRQEGADDADRTGDPERRAVTPGVDDDRAQPRSDQTGNQLRAVHQAVIGGVVV